MVTDVVGELLSFEQAQQLYNELAGRYRQGTLSPQDYTAQVAALRVIDQRGITWQPDPAGGGWLYWDGARWLPGQPFPAAPPRRQSTGPAGKRRRAKGVLNLTGRTGDGRRIPLKQRTRFWWDALSVWAGLVVGLVWFAYSAVRGLPKLNALNLRTESPADLLPALVILAVPVGMIVLRRTVLARVNLLLLKLNSWETGRKVGMVAGLAAGAWIVCEVVGRGMRASNLFNMREQLDLATPVAMVLIPLMLVLFRRETDGWLRPLQAVLKHIPKILLTLVALAVPYLLGYYLYNSAGLSQYHLLKWNVILGILISYVLLRTPQAAGGRTRPIAGMATLWLLAATGWLLWEVLGGAQPAWADDFLKDPFNLKDGLRTGGVAPLLSGTAALLGLLGVNLTEILRNLTGASGDGGGGGQSSDRTELRSGDRAIQWLRDNNFVDDNNRFTPEFTDWYNQLPSDPNPTDLQGIAGEFDPAGGQVPDDLTIAITDRSQPPVPDDGGSGQGQDDGADSGTDTGTGDDGGDKPDEPDQPEKPEEKTPPPPPPPVKVPEPPKPEPVKQPEPEQPPPQPPPPPKKDDKPAIKFDPSMFLVPPNINTDGMIQYAGMAGGITLSDISKWLHRQGDRIRYPFEWFYNWYKNDWLKTCEGTKITDKHRLPDHIKDRGLFDTSRDSKLSQGLKQTMLNAGVDPRVADEVLKRIEAEGAEDARIARLANSLLRKLRALNQGAQALPQGDKWSAGAAAGHDYVGPDATAFVERLVLTQQSNYQNAYDNWRDTQDTRRYLSTGAGVTGPKTQQEVDALIKDLQAEQRAIKNELGHDMQKMRNDERMRRLWKEEKALKDLKKECADLNLIKRLQK